MWKSYAPNRRTMCRPRWHRALLVFALQCGFAAAKKRKQPAVPTELLSGCPFHREKASTDELSEFGHELERDGRKLEAERCYARAIRSSPQAATGWFDLAAARQYSDQSAAIRYYRHGLKLRPSGEPSRAPVASLSHPDPPPRAYRAGAGFQYNQFGVVMRQTERRAGGCRRRHEPPGSVAASAATTAKAPAGHSPSRAPRRSTVGAPGKASLATVLSSRRAGTRRRRSSSARPRGCSRPMRTRSSTWEAATSSSRSLLRRCMPTGVRRTRRGIERGVSEGEG